jgi:hypothetical protein
VVAIEQAPDRRQRTFGQHSGEIHGHLSRPDQRRAAAPGNQIAEGHAVIFRHHADHQFDPVRDHQRAGILALERRQLSHQPRDVLLQRFDRPGLFQREGQFRFGSRVWLRGQRGRSHGRRPYWPRCDFPQPPLPFDMRAMLLFG